MSKREWLVGSITLFAIAGLMTARALLQLAIILKGGHL